MSLTSYLGFIRLVGLLDRFVCLFATLKIPGFIASSNALDNQTRLEASLQVALVSLSFVFDR